MVCRMGDCQQQCASNDGWNTEKNQSWPLAFDPSCEKCSTNRSHNLDSTKRNVQKNGVERVEAKAANNQRAERCDTSGRNRDRKDQRKPEPSLQVKGGLPQVVPFPLVGDYTHLVCSETFDGDHLFVFIKKLRSSRVIRQENAAMGEHNENDYGQRLETYKTRVEKATVIRPQTMKII
jgi:hypothetical protein